MKRKLLLLVICTICIAVWGTVGYYSIHYLRGANPSSAYSDKSPQNFEEVRFSGFITDLNYGCLGEGSCSVEIDNKHKVIIKRAPVFSSEGQVISSNGPRGKQVDIDLSENESSLLGKKVEVFGRKTKYNNQQELETYTIYGKETYFIKFLP